MYASINNKTQLFAQPKYLSPRYYKTGKSCKFRFYYHMNGTAYTLLTVNIRRNNIDTYLWHDEFRLSNEWRNATVEIPACLTDFQVCKIVILFVVMVLVRMAVTVAEVMRSGTDTVILMVVLLFVVVIVENGDGYR